MVAGRRNHESENQKANQDHSVGFASRIDVFGWLFSVFIGLRVSIASSPQPRAKRRTPVGIRGAGVAY